MEENERRNFEFGIFFMLLYCIALAFYGLFSKLGLTLQSIFIFLFSRYFIALILILPVLLAMRSFKGMNFFSDIKPQLLRAVVMIVAQYFFFYYLTKNSLLNATVLYNTGPIFIPIILGIFYNHPFGKKVWMSIGISFIGVLFILRPDREIFNIYSLFGLLSGFCMGLSKVLFGNKTKTASTGLNLFYLLFLCSAISAIPMFLVDGLVKKDLGFLTSNLFHSDWIEWAFVLGVALSIILTQLLQGIAYKFASAERLAPFIYIVVVFSGIFDWWIYKNPPDIFVAIGTILVIGGGILEWYFCKKEHDKIA